MKRSRQRDFDDSRSALVRLKDAVVLLTLRLPALVAGAVSIYCIVTVATSTGLFRDDFPNRLTPAPTNADGSPVRRPSIADGIEQRKVASRAWQELQHTPTGRVGLGVALFERLDLACGAQQILFKALRHSNPLHYDVPLRFREWHQLQDWSDLYIPAIREREDYRRELARFEALSRLASRTPAEEEEMWGIVLTCGRKWLSIPFDETKQCFDLHAPLPENAIEVAACKAKRMLELREMLKERESMPDPDQEEFDPSRFEPPEVRPSPNGS